MPALGTIVSTTSVPTSAEFDDHSARHENGGADEISVAGLSGTLADPQTAAAHAAAHQDGGADEISIAGLAGTPLDLTAHLGDTADAHDASAVSYDPTASGMTATDVQAAIDELEAAGGHDAVTVGTGLDVTGQLVELDLSEVAAGGELAGFLDAPTVDVSHSGSTHAAAQAAAEATAAGALGTHEADTTSIHGIANTANLYAAGGTDVAVADGGTGAGTASGARTNLGLVIGTDVPAQATFDDHSARHENGGADEISLAGLDGTSVDLAAHIADTTAAHAASAVAFTPNGSIAATDVQAAIQEVRDEASGGSLGAGFFGDGSDGALTLTQATAAPAWAAKSGAGATTLFTLSRDVYATTFDLDDSGGNFLVKTNGFRIFANVSLTIDAGVVVHHDGNAAVAATAGANLSAGTIGQASGAGSAGAVNTTATQAAAITFSAATTITSATAHGGTGGAATGGGTGGGVAGGTASRSAIAGTPGNLSQAFNVRIAASSLTAFNGGGGGTGGNATGGATATGGGGGGGSGIVAIYAKLLTNNGIIRAQGGAGGNAAIGNGTGAGGGAGGGGGAIVLVIGGGSTTGTLTVTGGTGGTLAGTGATGGTGVSGLTYILVLS